MSLKDNIFQVMELQKSFFAKDNDAMRSRRQLIKAIEKELKNDLKHFADCIHLSVKGKDNSFGKNSIVPWVRVFDETSSPKPTEGWYIVILFPAEGSKVFLSLNQGTNTVGEKSEFRQVPEEVISQRAELARAELVRLGLVPKNSINQISLQARKTARNLAEGYENANVYAFEFTPNTPDFDRQLLEGIRQLEKCRQVLVFSPIEPGLGKQYKKSKRPRKDKLPLQIITKDPAKLERATQAHFDTQDGLAEIITSYGLKPLSPKGQPDYDLALNDGNVFWVIEVKSLPEGSEISQVRIGIGQILHYRAQLLRLSRELEVRPVLALERKPDLLEVWQSVCDNSKIVLTYGPDFEALHSILGAVRLSDAQAV